jgi:hypothetical protein
MAKSIKVPLKYFSTNEEFQNFVDTEREWMYSRIVASIEDAFRRGKNVAKILEAKIEETMSVISMDSDIDEWENSLGLALKWYEETENYEKCSEVFKLISDIRTVAP